MRFAPFSAILLAFAILGCANHDNSPKAACCTSGDMKCCANGGGDCCKPTADNGATTKPHHSPLIHY